MSSSADALNIVQSLVRRTHNARIGYAALVTYAEKYLAKAADEDPSLEDFADNPSNMMAAYLVELEEQGSVRLRYVDGSISSVHYPQYYISLINSVYERIEQQPERPYPAEDGLPVQLPADVVHPVDVKTDFVRWIVRADSDGRAEVLRLMFPDGISSMVITTDLVQRTMPRLAVQKLRSYLRSERNAGYMRSKLASIFRQREMAMKDMLSSILTTPDQALRTIFNPTDFTFHFWTQLSSMIIKEYSQKKDKLAEEHGYCQAAYLLGYYNVHHRGVQQRNRDRETALRQLEVHLHQLPYTFTISEIHAFADQRGVPLTRKYSLDDVNEYISSRVKPSDETSLPRMIRVRSEDESEYYVYRDHVLQVTVEHVFSARKEMRDHYVDTWKTQLEQNNRTPEMTDDATFARSVRARLKETDPLLQELLDYNLLFLSRKEVPVPADLASELTEIFHPKEPRLRPLPEIFNLERKKLYTDAKLLLPFWQAVPMISGLVYFLKRLLLGVSDDERLANHRRRRRQRPARTIPDATRAASEATTVHSGPNSETTSPSEAQANSSTRRAQVARFKDAVTELQKQYVHPGATPEQTLDELAERWNPLLNPVAKQNLVEDVNSLTRDFLRRMKVSFRLVPPTRARVEEWADRLSRNEAFQQIRRRDDLKAYLKLYMLTVLSS